MPIVHYSCLTLGRAWNLIENLSAFLKYRHMEYYADICIIFQRNEYSNSGMYFIRSLPVQVQWCFFLPGTENLQIFRENGTEKQSFCTMFFFCGSDIGKDFPVAEDLSENPADTGIIITNLFIGKRKICFNRKAFAMFGRTSPTTGLCRCKIIHDRINPCIANQIQIRIFINDGTRFCFVYQLSQRMMT